jgi:hypothetical protein
MWKRRFSMVLVTLSAFALGDRAIAQGSSAKALSGKPLAGYSILVFEKLKVQPDVIQAGFAETQVPVLQAEIIVQLVQKKLFEQVIDRTDSPMAPLSIRSPQSDAKPELLLTGTITDFEPGSQAERYLVGMGAGAAKLKMHFSFRDAATGKEILFTDHQHKYWFGTFGGSKKKAMTRSAEEMVKSLMNDIKHNR